MTQVDAAELRVRLCGALQRSEAQAPEDDADHREEQPLKAEHEHGGDDGRDQREFALAAEEI